MPDPSEPGTPSVAEVRSRLQAAANALRESTAVDPAIKSTLGDLLAELNRALELPAAPPAEVARLADEAARLAEALHGRQDPDMLEANRSRLEELLIHAESRAPLVVRLARNVVEALADLGI